MANFLPTLLVIITLSAIPGRLAVDYTVTNTAAGTPGGAKFDTAIGADYSRQTLAAATTFIWEIFQQTAPSDRKNVASVDLFIDDRVLIGDRDVVALASGNQIHVSAQYINGYSGDVRREFTGVLYHEMTHIWQWKGNGQAPGGLIEGIADFVRLKAGYAPSHWSPAGAGERWNQGYDVTARFLEYCNDVVGTGNFVAELNKKMRNGYSDGFFEELLRKPVATLWSDYKARYSSS